MDQLPRQPLHAARADPRARGARDRPRSSARTTPARRPRPATTSELAAGPGFPICVGVTRDLWFDRVSARRGGRAGARRLRRGGGPEPDPSSHRDDSTSATDPAVRAARRPATTRVQAMSVRAEAFIDSFDAEQGPRALLPPPDPPAPAVASRGRTAPCTASPIGSGDALPDDDSEQPVLLEPVDRRVSASSATCCRCSTPTGPRARCSTALRRRRALRRLAGDRDRRPRRLVRVADDRAARSRSPPSMRSRTRRCS